MTVPIPPESAAGQAVVFVVIPTFNEAPAIRKTVDPLLALPLTVIVFNDASDDGTEQQLDGLGLNYLQHPVNLGQGAALQTGTFYTLENGTDIFVHFDADGQHRAEEIQRLFEPLRKGVADVALGFRFLRSEDFRAMPKVRRWLLRGIYLSDARNSSRAMTRAAASQQRLRPIRSPCWSNRQRLSTCSR